ncbi:hypothetical protein CAC42_67 [Sphaceloma murrayae]|uniref:HAD-like protein n=1 Tax=Sphaceloma murrayae TaxID=2082308 RepID=A0A2K1QN64_9PEZI|nr:hypothetical protein CAC42_67 [Sphaceloma murrayae]
MAPPKVVLFDIGGVCVISPMSAIATYEKVHSIPAGYINTAISTHAPNGAWQKAERGEIPLDATFFKLFKSDLSSPTLWRSYYIRHLQRTRSVSGPQAIEEAAVQTPPVPDIDAETLFWDMMGASRAPDPHIYPALKRLRQIADKEGKFIVAACSNTTIFPEGHKFNDPDTPEGRFNAELKGQFHLYVSSAHVGRRKPERRMYDYTLEACQRVAREKGVLGSGETLKGEDVVFLDDIGSNLKGAGEVGIKGIKVVIGKTEAAVKELEQVTGMRLGNGNAKL